MRKKSFTFSPQVTTHERKAELQALAALSDADIDTSDIPEVTDWHDAVRGKFYQQRKSLSSGCRE